MESCSFERCKDFWLGVDFDEGGLFDVTKVEISDNRDIINVGIKFSCHSQGIDYALAITGEESLYYGGHSMGCTQYLVMLATKPEYNKKVINTIVVIQTIFVIVF